MAIFGRRQPHKPLVLSGLTPAQPPVGRLVVARGAFAAQRAAEFYHRPLFQPAIRKAGPPAPVGRQVLAGRKASQDAAGAAHRPTFQPIVKTLIRFQAAAATTPNPRPAVVGTFAAIASANAAHRPLFQPTIKKPGAPPPVGRLVTARGDHAARDAANFAHRPLFQPQVKKLGAPAPVGRVMAFGRKAAQDAANFAHRPLFQPIRRGLIFYQPPAAQPPVGKIRFFGALASQAAAHSAAKLPLRALTFPFKPPAAFLRRRQLVPRDPLSGMKVGDARLKRFTEIVSSIFNSLILAGLVRQTGPEAWTVQAAAFVRTRAPLASDDTTAGAVAGSVWVDTTGPTVYLCTDAGRGVAAWAALSGGGGGGGLSGSFP